MNAGYIEGFAAYAYSQSQVYVDLGNDCRDCWSRPLKTRNLTGHLDGLDIEVDDD